MKRFLRLHFFSPTYCFRPRDVPSKRASTLQSFTTFILFFVFFHPPCFIKKLYCSGSAVYNYKSFKRGEFTCKVFRVLFSSLLAENLILRWGPLSAIGDVKRGREVSHDPLCSAHQRYACSPRSVGSRPGAKMKEIKVELFELTYICMIKRFEGRIFVKR